VQLLSTNPTGEEMLRPGFFTLIYMNRTMLGPLFRVMNRHGRVLDERLSGEAVAMVVKRYVWWLRHGFEDFAGHSLRAGLPTSAAAAGKSGRAVMNQTGHRPVRARSAFSHTEGSLSSYKIYVYTTTKPALPRLSVNWLRE
jgi:hypothetical protein